MATAARLVELWRSQRHPSIDDDVVACWMDAEAYRWQTYATVARLMDGAKPGAEASLTKLFWSELDVRLHETALRLLGPDAELEGPWMKGFQFALAGPIYAGTNEIQRNVVGERVLGLPR
jgi:alkylation response protein AidB-like acyl-CoA dehydrogenase